MGCDLWGYILHDDRAGHRGLIFAGMRVRVRRASARGSRVPLLVGALEPVPGRPSAPIDCPARWGSVWKPVPAAAGRTGGEADVMALHI